MVPRGKHLIHDNVFTSWHYFMSKVIPEPMSGCWLWTGLYDKNGYGKICVKRKHTRAHRYIWSLLGSRNIPTGKIIQHKCDTPSCVNPDHLELGTWLSNMQDKVKKGRLKNQYSKRTHCKHLYPDVFKKGSFFFNGKEYCVKCAAVVQYKAAYKKRIREQSVC